MKKMIARIICVGLLFSSIASPMHAARGDDAQKKMTKFQKTVKTFQKKLNQYDRCLKRKCSNEEKQQIKSELKTVAKKVALYGGLVLAAVLVFRIGRAVVSGAVRFAIVHEKYGLSQEMNEDEKQLLSASYFSKNLGFYEGLNWTEIGENVKQASAHFYYGLPLDQDVTLEQVNSFLTAVGGATEVTAEEIEVETVDPLQPSTFDID